MEKKIIVERTTRGAPWLLLATIGLAVAKVAGYLNIGWWLVTAPLWAPIAIVVAIFAIIGIIFLLTLVVWLVNDTLRARKVRNRRKPSYAP